MTKKRHILLAVVLMIGVFSYAQVLIKAPQSQFSMAKQRAGLITQNRRATITPTDNQVWWGYFSESDVAGLSSIGTGAQEDFEGAIFIPANHPVVGNGTIKAIRIWFNEQLAGVKGMKVWITQSLGNNASGADMVQDVSVSSLIEGANDIALNNPYSVGGKGIYIGYTVQTKTSGVYPLACAGAWVENSFFIRGSKNVPTWGPVSDFGMLALQVLVEGASLSENSVEPYGFETTCVVKGETASVPVKIKNTGSKPVTSISYTITTGDVTTAEQTIDVDETTFNNYTSVMIPFQSDEEMRKYSKQVTITKVNGAENAAENKTVSGTLITIFENADVMPVVEEFTGTWCGWCTVGMDGLQKMHEKYGNKVALIAAHGNDPMEISDYYAIMNRGNGFPSSFVNRRYSVYPAAVNLDYYLTWELSSSTVANIKAEAMWTSTEKETIKIDTNTRFLYSEDGGDYGLAYVLVADGLKGTGSDWSQANNLSGNAEYKNIEFWYNAPARVSGYEFNHVAVGAWDIEKGVSGSIQAPFQPGVDLPNTFEADITSKSVIQDKSKLKVIALLIDRATGAIANAAQTEIKDFAVITNYKLTYMVDGVEYKSYDLETGTAITAEAAPEKEGYTFSGWSEIPATMPAQDVVVTGTFTINKYKLTYQVDGVDYQSYEVEYGSAITAEAAPEKEGYTFSGWSEIPATMPAQDVVITGTFTVNKYKLTYMLDGEVYKEVEYEYGATIVPEPQPQEGDYSQFEWNDLPETMPASNVTVHASYVSGINGLTTTQGTEVVYGTNGQRVGKSQKGVKIIRSNSGTTRKVVGK